MTQNKNRKNACVSKEIGKLYTVLEVITRTVIK